MTSQQSPTLAKGYRSAPEIRARLEVLYEKAHRVVAYNRTLDPAVLDEKQVATMVRYACRLGVDGFPIDARRNLVKTIDVLQTRLKALGCAPHIASVKLPLSRRRLSLGERFRVRVLRWTVGR